MTKPRSGNLSLIPVSEIAAQLAGQAETLCRHLLPGGYRDGSEWRAGSVQGEPGTSLGVHLKGAKAGVWADFATEQSGDLLDLIEGVLSLDTAGAIGWAKNWLGIDDAEISAPTPRPRPAAKPERQDEDTAKRIKAALAIWSASRPAPGTPVESYLRGRSIMIPVPPILRYNPGVKYAQSGLLLPCMVAAVQAPDRSITGIHRTWIRDDGTGKANVVTPKMALGVIGRGGVRLGQVQPALGIAEGIETALSVTQIFSIPCRAALGSGMASVDVPEEVIEVQIFGDNGDAGHEAAQKAAEAFKSQGLHVFLRAPPTGFDDWNSFLQGQKSEAVA